LKRTVLQIILVTLILTMGCSKTPSTTTAKVPTTTAQVTTNVPQSSTTATTTSIITSTTATQPPTTSATTTPGTGKVTAKDMANLGSGVFDICTACHGGLGDGGSGPALIGPRSSLLKYGNAGGLLAYISRSMPLNNPGSLTTTQYMQIMAYLLVQNNYISPNDVWDGTILSTIILK
jgi:mono/diheme cytochrome c family protein